MFTILFKLQDKKAGGHATMRLVLMSSRNTVSRIEVADRDRAGGERWRDADNGPSNELILEVAARKLAELLMSGGASSDFRKTANGYELDLGFLR